MRWGPKGPTSSNPSFFGVCVFLVLFSLVFFSFGMFCLCCCWSVLGVVIYIYICFCFFIFARFCLF